MKFLFVDEFWKKRKKIIRVNFGRDGAGKHTSAVRRAGAWLSAGVRAVLKLVSATCHPFYVVVFRGTTSA